MPRAATPNNKAAVTGPSTSNGRPLSERDMRVLAASFSCITGPINVDYDKLAEICELKDKKSAYKLLWDIKKKLGVEGGGATEQGGTKTPGSGKRGRTPTDREIARGGDDDDDEEPDETPVKKKKASLAAKAKQPTGDIDADLKKEAASDDYEV